jgi:cytochrome c biogenesis protein CcmG, thiol:disulfide interchange protein DsbE
VKRIYVISLIILFSAALIAQDSKTTELSGGKTAPEFRLQDIDKNTVELKKITGKGPVLINFWATWCKPCVEEMAEFSKIYNELKDKGFEMLAVSVDNEKTVAKVKPFVKSKNFNFTVLLDTNGETARKYYVQAVPATFLLDKDGRIVYQSSGFKKGDEIKLRKKIEELL